ncbi:MAG: T9SS type A sorting domain-containing protein, partial [candidate division Zixibacteria bacterium]|nr:T9SS type A sorting domain-containing protein [Gammaproteobacteria bacterium]NIX56240.1 T9SS type A sorting domain-containing protein [candidate division Zixibacteria bacterium]
MSTNRSHGQRRSRNTNAERLFPVSKLSQPHLPQASLCDNPTTSITFELSQNTSVELKIFDIQGRLVRTLVNNQLPAGQHRVTWDGRNDNGSQVSSGVYLYRIQAGKFSQV